MHIEKLFNKKEVVFSFEIFPPKLTSPIETIYNTLEELSDLKPDYISVTFGAGGNAINNRTCEISSLVKNKYGIEALAHLTCINSSKNDIHRTLLRLKEKGIENILALRGDIPKDAPTSGDFNSACELINYINSHENFGISSACYPEGHIESESFDQDIKALKAKVAAGASHAISQLFFDNNYFYNFLVKANDNGINIPIQAGIMPIINKRQIERIVSLCGATIPPKFIKIMNKYEHDKEALRDAGIAYAQDQIVDLISTGVRGIHLYTMNNPYVARKIIESISSVINSVNKKQII
ncbi:MAG: methylenetetrahydrofolate reductase [Clostridiaceae bacterium]|jgi:methylenetetrahydrofolate reductase (NADPH)|nr:methylenetetrahydrofolate reductase [Clostridiaceae bacterium]